MDQKVSLGMGKAEEIEDVTNLPIPEQLSRVDDSITKAQNGAVTVLLTSSHIVGTYALPKSLGKRIKCKISPTNVPTEWRLDIGP